MSRFVYFTYTLPDGKDYVCLTDTHNRISYTADYSTATPIEFASDIDVIARARNRDIWIGEFEIPRLPISVYKTAQSLGDDVIDRSAAISTFRSLISDRIIPS